MKRFTLHVRMTKKCNADCSYCSSWQANPLAYMKVEEFKKSIDYIVDTVLPMYGFSYDGNSAVSIQYVGGEIATVPKPIMYKCVFYARQRMGEIFGGVTDGIQSNLIASERKVSYLATLFGDRIGTSVDTNGIVRTVAGSPDKYKEILAKNIKFLSEKRNIIPGRIFVVDSVGLENARIEFDLANSEGYSLVYRPVFHGGKDVGAASVDELSSVLGDIFDSWIMSSSISVEPFHQLLVERLSEFSNDDGLKFHFGCPFQAECAEVSLDLEPNGDLYVCLDMADSDQMRLGNAVTGEFDNELWGDLRRRKEKLDADCNSCKWLDSCHGGCMSEALHSTQSIYGKTELCGLWKTIFSKIDHAIERHGVKNVVDWSNSLK